MDFAALCQEYQSLVGGHVKKAYQPEREVVVLRLNTTEGKRELVIRTGRAFFLTGKGPENPPQPTGFAMMLRKYLTNGRITSIEQEEFDRILRIRIQKEEEFELIIEGFGDGNIVLVKAGQIIQPLISRSWRHRVVRAGHPYETPPSRANPMKMRAEEFQEIILNSERDIVRTLAMEVNLGGSYAEELCLRTGIRKERMCESLSLDEIAALFQEMRNLFISLKNLEPGIVRTGEDGAQIDVVPFPLRIYWDFDYHTFESFNDAVEEYFFSLMKADKEKAEGAEPVNPAVERIKRTIEQQRETIKTLKRTIDEEQEKAERLFLRYQEFDRILKEIRDYGERHGWTEMAMKLQESPKVMEINPAEKFVVLHDNPTDIRLHYMEFINDNAQRYYAAVRRAKEKLEGAEKALEESMKKLEKEKKEIVREEERKKVERKHFYFEKYRWFFTSRGNLVIGGKDAHTNDQVVKKYLKERDRYAHAEIHGAPSLVIKALPNTEQEFDEKSLEEACTYAGCFSRAWTAKIGSVEAYWVYPDQVSKTPAAGEFLARGAFIVRGKRNRMTVPLRLAIGNIIHEGVKLLMCAPVSAVEAYTNSYLIIEPGETPKNSFANELVRLFNVTHAEALSILPGDVRVARITGLKREQPDTSTA